MRCWSKNKHEKDGQPPRAWGKNHHRPAADQKNHAGHHGGAWKVAFADFTLAMMALFMTLWIVNSVSKSERESIIAALHGQSILTVAGCRR